MKRGDGSEGFDVGEGVLVGGEASAVPVGAAGVRTQPVSSTKATIKVRNNRFLVINASRSCQSVNLMHEMCL